jgi:hypothetical protein
LPGSQYASRLLCSAIEYDRGLIGQLERLGLIPTLILKLEPVEQATSASVDTVQALIASGCLDHARLYDLGRCSAHAGAMYPSFALSLSPFPVVNPFFSGLLPKLNALFIYSFGHSTPLVEPIVGIFVVLLDTLSAADVSRHLIEQNKPLLCNVRIIIFCTLCPLADLHCELAISDEMI